jgi:hypothetical protein
MKIVWLGQSKVRPFHKRQQQQVMATGLQSVSAVMSRKQADHRLVSEVELEVLSKGVVRRTRLPISCPLCTLGPCCWPP